ncbi:hypothetical protein [Saccharomonospora saliphila]|uniref:hypothetical protein n=1 Tax=Saccharomonospora saliphila TaxID=369829 RepID=UPI0018DC3DCF|nr:hypothetical protein [Saccharomonospora saliphila]
MREIADLCRTYGDSREAAADVALALSVGGHAARRKNRPGPNRDTPCTEHSRGDEERNRRRIQGHESGRIHGVFV